MTPSRVGPGEPLAGSDDPPAPQSAPSRQALPSASDKPQVTSIGPDFEMDCILRIAGGDRSAFEQLFRSYHKRLFRYLCRMLSKADAAEELASDVLFEVWKRASGFRGESKVSTWIFGIARFRAISWLRKSNPKLVDLDDAAMVCDSHELQDEVLVKASTREAVRGALGKLTPQHQEVMELTFYQGFSYPEIATILACPVNTVKTRMFYARKELRDLLREEGSI
jgi:RNA polymerase sigma-70 factor, ECF subfamily